jgi:Protein of unknown function (DUF4232)
MARGRSIGLAAVVVIAAMSSAPALASATARVSAHVAGAAHRASTPLRPVPAATVPPCGAGATRLRFGATGLDASHVNAVLVLTNESRAACTLLGAPRVRFVSRSGRQIGNLSRPTGPGGSPVVLGVAGSVHALLRTSVPGAWSPATCRPRMAWGVLVAAPGSSRWSKRHFPLSVCAGLAVHESTTTPVAPGPGPDPAACTAAQLAVSLGAPQGAAGTTYVPIVFTNPVLYTCTLRGFPSVRSVRGAGDEVVGPPATHAGTRAFPVWVQPFGGAASAAFGVVDTGALPAASCRPRRASGIEVTPPHTGGATVLAYNHVVCTGLASTSVTAVVIGPDG